MPGLTIRKAEERDLRDLAALNRQLLEDEGNLVEASLDDLMARHREWMRTGEWSQDILDLAGETVGYIVHTINPYPLTPGTKELFLRQFCIDRAKRGHGFGRVGFQLFLRHRLPPGGRVTLDVLESNTAGQAFWEAVGCRPFFRRMEAYRPPGGGDEPS
jgi:ribosomal protein S18 acetylase RimI-like enzyme